LIYLTIRELRSLYSVAEEETSLLIERKEYYFARHSQSQRYQRHETVWRQSYADLIECGVSLVQPLMRGNTSASLSGPLDVIHVTWRPSSAAPLMFLDLSILSVCFQQFFSWAIGTFHRPIGTTNVIHTSRLLPLIFLIGRL
jgi:hypothetical protein